MLAYWGGRIRVFFIHPCVSLCSGNDICPVAIHLRAAKGKMLVMMDKARKIYDTRH